MDIPQKLMQHRYQISAAMIASIAILLVSYAAPRLVTILAYFGPLFASTAVLLVVIIVFGGLSQLVNEAHGEKAGEGFLDYVAATPDQIYQS